MELTEDLRISELRVFSQVAQFGSFSAAAKALNITQSAVSKRIRKVESALDISLFDRSGRHLQLTESGAQLLQYCSRILDEVESTVRYVQQRHVEPAGELSIGMQPWLWPLLGSDFVHAFMEKYPKIRLTFPIPSPERWSGEIETDIIMSAFIPTNRQLRVFRLFDLKMNFFASEQYLRKHPTISHPRQLVQHKCLCFSHDYLKPGEWYWTDESGQTMSVQTQPTLFFEYVPVGAFLAAEGSGVTWCPEQIVDLLKVRPQLVKVFRDDHCTFLPFYAMHKSFTVTPPKIRVFMDAVQEKFAQQT